MKHTTIPILFGALLCLSGCTAQDLATVQQARDQAATTIQQAQAAQTQIRQQLTTMPADDPVREQLQPLLDQLGQIITKAQAYLPALDASIKTLQNGQIDPSVQQEVSVIPYGSLALAIISIIFGIVKHVQAGNMADNQQQIQKAFEQVVAAMDAVVPTPTPEQQAKVDSVLDADVKAQVAAVKAK